MEITLLQIGLWDDKRWGAVLHIERQIMLNDNDCQLRKRINAPQKCRVRTATRCRARRCWGWGLRTNYFKTSIVLIGEWFRTRSGHNRIPKPCAVGEDRALHAIFMSVT
jgi:hypothetical protein